MNKVILFSILLMFSSSSWAQINLNSSLGSRYHTDRSGKNIQQSGVSLSVVGTLKNGYKIVSFVGTGPQFRSNWDKLYDYNNPDELQSPQNIHLRQLFLQKDFKKNFVQFGALAPWQGIMTYSAMNKKGWVDGARVHLNGRLGKMTVTAGSIYDTNNPSAITRKRKLNYFDIHLSKEVFDRLVIELGIDNTENILYSRSAIEYQLPKIGDKVISIVMEELTSLNDAQKNIQFNAGVNFKTPIKRIFNKELKNTSLELGLNYSYVSAGFDPSRAALESYSFLYQEGHQVNSIIKLKTGSFTWFSNTRVSNNPKFIFGVKKNIKWKSKRKRPKKAPY